MFMSSGWLPSCAPGPGDRVNKAGQVPAPLSSRCRGQTDSKGIYGICQEVTSKRRKSQVGEGQWEKVVEKDRRT